MTTQHPAGERTVSERLRGAIHSNDVSQDVQPLYDLIPAIELLEEENRRLRTFGAGMARYVAWIEDVKHPNDPSPEVQNDLRQTADALERGDAIPVEVLERAAATFTALGSLSRVLSGEGEDGR